MANEKNINSRIQHKHDTEANWNKATNFSPKQGEIIVYDVDANYSYERFKIGDGIKKVNELPFANANIDSTLSVEGSAADAKVVGDIIVSKQDSITGTEGQFVVIGADGKPTVKTIPSAEGVNF